MADPDERAEIVPALDTEATEVLLLVQLPPVDGDRVDVEPIHKLFGPERMAAGLSFTVTGNVGSEVQPIPERENVNVALPAVKAVTNPVFGYTSN